MRLNALEKYYYKYLRTIMSCQKSTETNIPKAKKKTERNKKKHNNKDNDVRDSFEWATIVVGINGSINCGKPTQVYSNLFFNA